MKTLLSTTALVGALALFAAPAFATQPQTDDCACSVDVVLNLQLNLGSPTTAIGVDAYGKKVIVDVKNLDVLAVGNLNDTTAHGGGHFRESTRSSERSSESTYDKDGAKFDLSYEKKTGSYSSGTRKSFSLSGSAWSKSKTSASSSAREATRTSADRNRVFVGSLQKNFRSPTTAIGVDASAGSSRRHHGGLVKVTAKNVSVTAVGNMNTTNLK